MSKDPKIANRLDFRQAVFTTSAAKLAACPEDSYAEVAFAGRSNAGKSSAINAITEQTRLARTSKTPGRTQLINFFTLQANCYLVDLPGYGFAKVPLAVRDQWQKELENYLRNRQQLCGLVLLSDIRHPLKEFDRMMVDWAEQSGLPLLLLLTKADKLKRGAAQNTLLQVRRELKEVAMLNVQLFSSHNQQGVNEARKQLNEWLLEDDEEPTPPDENPTIDNK